MKIAILSTHVRWPSHYETELELMQQHLNKKDEVLHLVCNGELAPCDQFGPSTSTMDCFKCINSRLIGKDLLEGNVRTIPINHQTAHDFSLNKIDTTEIKKIRHKEFDLGYAALSSLISTCRDPEPSIQYLGLLNKMLAQGCDFYDWCIAFLQKEKPDCVYVFNGRLLYPKAMLRACQSLNIKVLVHERGSSIQHYELFNNTTPHDLKYIESRINEYWDQSELTVEDKTKIGSSFYLERRNGQEQSWYSFVKDQKADQLPKNWDNTKKNVVIFNSSEDEFVSIGDDWKRFVYDNQILGVQNICKGMLDNPEYHFYLRMHPNLKNVKNESVSSLLNLKLDNLTIIPSASDISTYALIDVADKVITFGSTVGIESVFFNKPSILLGSCFYRNLNATYNPETEQELLSFIKTDLTVKDAVGALKYGFYMKSYGIKFEHYKATGVIEGKYKGEDIYRSNKINYKLKVFYKLRFFRKSVPKRLLDIFLNN